MKIDKFGLILIGYIAFSGAALGYLGTDESFKYINSTLRWYIIGWFVTSNATAASIKGVFTDSHKRSPSITEPPTDGSTTAFINKNDLPPIQQIQQTVIPPQ